MAFLVTILKILTYALVSTWSSVSSRYEHVPQLMQPCCLKARGLAKHELYAHMHSWPPANTLPTPLLGLLEATKKLIQSPLEGNKIIRNAVAREDFCRRVVLLGASMKLLYTLILNSVLSNDSETHWWTVGINSKSSHNNSPNDMGSVNKTLIHLVIRLLFP